MILLKLIFIFLPFFCLSDNLITPSLIVNLLSMINYGHGTVPTIFLQDPKLSKGSGGLFVKSILI